jgi:hypothetical protein
MASLECDLELIWHPHATSLSLIRESHSYDRILRQLQRIFWSKYRRKVLGPPWPGNFVCPCKEEFERSQGRKTVDLATSNDMNEMHDLLFPMLDEYNRTSKRRKTGP